MKDKEEVERKVITVVAVTGFVVNIAVSVMFSWKNRESSALFFLLGAFYCLSKAKFKKKDKSSEEQKSGNIA